MPKSALVSPLDEIDTSDLYRMLGEAWCAQFLPHKGESYTIESNQKIGKREFASLRRFLKPGLAQDDRLAIMSAVTEATREKSLWRMPADIVATLTSRESV